MKTLNITLIQTELYWHNPAKNRAMFSDMIAKLDTPTDLVILPEMFTTGFTMQTHEQAELMSGETVRWMYATAKKHNLILMGSLIIEEHGDYYNRLMWMPPDGHCSHYDKRHLFRMAEEHHHYTAGTDRLIVELNGWRICPLICYDLRFPVFSRNCNDYDLLIYVANWPAKRRYAWQTLLKARAIENLAYVVGVNRIGQDGNGIAYSGDSAVLNYLGRELTSQADTPLITTVTLDYTALQQYRDSFPAHLDADAFTLS